MDPFTKTDLLIADIVGRIEADDGFATVNVLREDKGVTTTDINSALKTLKVKGGKMGAAVVVAMPEKAAKNPNMPGPFYDLVIRVRCYESPTFNRSASGTGLTAANLSLRVEHLLDKVSLGGVTLNYERTDPGVFSDGDTAVEITFGAWLGMEPATRVQKPRISLAAGQIVISCATLGATVRYVVDGTYPSTSTQEYSAPFAPAASCTIRAVAYAAGFQASDLTEATFTA